MAYMNRSKLVIDKDVRHAFYEYIRLRKRSSMFIHELAFQVGQEEGRIDLIAVDTQVHGFEIKSDADSLDRLKRQVRIYGKVMDTMSVVVTHRHERGARKIVPSFWGVYTYANGDITELRAPGENTEITPRAVAGLLWKDRALQLLSDNGLERGFARKAKHVLHEHIAAHIDFPIIKEAVCLQLKSHRRSI